MIVKFKAKFNNDQEYKLIKSESLKANIRAEVGTIEHFYKDLEGTPAVVYVDDEISLKQFLMDKNTTAGRLAAGKKFQDMFEFVDTVDVKYKKGLVIIDDTGAGYFIYAPEEFFDAVHNNGLPF